MVKTSTEQADGGNDNVLIDNNGSSIRNAAIATNVIVSVDDDDDGVFLKVGRCCRFIRREVECGGLWRLRGAAAAAVDDDDVLAIF